MIAEVIVDVFQGSACGFDEEQVYERHERQVQDGPDDLYQYVSQLQ